jgi:hypothetical protein
MVPDTNVVTWCYHGFTLSMYSICKKIVQNKHSNSHPLQKFRAN